MSLDSIRTAEELVRRWLSVDPHGRKVIADGKLGLERDVAEALDATKLACRILYAPVIEAATQYVESRRRTMWKDRIGRWHSDSQYLETLANRLAALRGGTG